MESISSVVYYFRIGRSFVSVHVIIGDFWRIGMKLAPKDYGASFPCKILLHPQFSLFPAGVAFIFSFFRSSCNIYEILPQKNEFGSFLITEAC